LAWQAINIVTVNIHSTREIRESTFGQEIETALKYRPNTLWHLIYPSTKYYNKIKIVPKL